MKKLMPFKRELNLSSIKESFFLFGPRMTGKSSLLSELKSEAFFDLLDPEKELRYKQDPGLFWREIQALPPKSTIIIDEVQRAPKLLDYVQMGMQKFGFHFMLSGSSARKLKRGSANLLGGRALDLKLHPLIPSEIANRVSIDKVLAFGSLPKVLMLVEQGDLKSARLILRSYLTTYLKEEIQAEAITRNLGNFSRFLNIAAQANGQVIEYQNIARESGVPASTVKEYYSILEDTLIGKFLWPLDRSERKKARPKFYFFDTGVVRSIQNRLEDPPTSSELGFLFETWMVQMFFRLRDYDFREHQFSLWREGKHEIDLIVESGHGPIMAVEFKSGKKGVRKENIIAFKKRFPKVPIIIAGLVSKSQILDGGVELHPWNKVLEMYQAL